jgi:DNA-binding MarR family transcriptional regulator
MYFKSSLFSEPAWDILLELLAAEGHEKRVTISTAGLTAGIPATTALRWIRALEREGLVTRADDPFDRRRSFVTLTVDGLKRLTRYFETCHEAVELIGPR